MAYQPSEQGQWGMPESTRYTKGTETMGYGRFALARSPMADPSLDAKSCSIQTN